MYEKTTSFELCLIYYEIFSIAERTLLQVHYSVFVIHYLTCSSLFPHAFEVAFHGSLDRILQQRGFFLFFCFFFFFLYLANAFIFDDVLIP